MQGDAVQISRLVPFFRAVAAVRKRFGAGASKSKRRAKKPSAPRRDSGPGILDRILGMLPASTDATPPRYALRMQLAGKWRQYQRKPNVMPKHRRPQRVPT